MKKTKTLLTGFLLCILTNSYSQNGKVDTARTPDNVKHIEKTCTYPGGQAALLKDIADNFIVPKQAKKDKLKGAIYLKIIVDTTGFAKGEILKGLRPDVDSAAIEMTKKLKQFEPSLMDNKKVPTTLNVPLIL